MIKTIIFDLDGVLLSSRELHYEALNMALNANNWPSISLDEHLSTYDGRSTSVKLNMLSERNGLPAYLHDAVWREKQKATLKLIKSMTPDHRMLSILEELKNRNYHLICASNSIRETLKMMLLKKGFLEFIDQFISNQDVQKPKPHPEIYMKAMLLSDSSPKETLIIEDSHIGRKSAMDSGAFLLGVENPEGVTLEKILNKIEEIDRMDGSANIKWQGGKMNVLIPMAGAGSRFQQMGYTFPKPLIEVNEKPMIQVVVENLNIDAKHIFVVQREHFEKYNLKYLLSLIAPNYEIVQVDGMTEGAACTTLLAKEFINNDEPLLLANSDQWIDWDSNQFMYSMSADAIDGGILTFSSTNCKWSFAKLDDDGFVCEVAEKKVISDLATCGAYYFRKGSDYVKYAEQMIEKNIRTNGEFYVCPVFNEAIADGKKIKAFNIETMFGLGTPEDLERFLERTKK